MSNKVARDTLYLRSISLKSLHLKDKNDQLLDKYSALLQLFIHGDRKIFLSTFLEYRFFAEKVEKNTIYRDNCPNT